MRIPILDLSSEIDSLWPQLNEAFQSVLKSGQFIMGPNVKALETELAAYLNVKHAVGLNSGTDALVLGLRALDIGEGDEVLTSPFTFFATAEAISMVGATPVFVDIEPHSYNLDARQLKAKITSRTKAILPVHLYGNSCAMDEILALAKLHGLRVLEDVAQAMGGEYQGKKLGTLGDIGAFSFFPSKNLGAFGDGGMLATNDDKLAETARMLRTHGSRKKYYNEAIGYNSRLDELQAAMLRVKLPHLDHANKGRREVASRYAEILGSVPGVQVPTETAGAKHVFHQYTVRLTTRSRDEVHKKLETAGIGTMVYYPVPLHRLPVYASAQETYPVTETACAQVLSLPIWPTMPAKTLLEVTSALAEALR